MNKLAKIFVNESLLSFDEWYFTNTIRAINQGLGRVIRH
jgi:Rad3-related DNA helicase